MRLPHKSTYSKEAKGVSSSKNMNTTPWKLLPFATLLTLTAHLCAQQTASPQDAQRPAATSPAGPKHQDTEVWEPEPAVVTPGAVNTAPPSDAIVLFDGKNLDEWVSAKDKSPAQWIVADGVLTGKQKGRQHRNQANFSQLSATHRVENSRKHYRHRPGPWQQRRVSCLHRTRRRRL